MWPIRPQRWGWRDGRCAKSGLRLGSLGDCSLACVESSCSSSSRLSMASGWGRGKGGCRRREREARRRESRPILPRRHLLDRSARVLAPQQQARGQVRREVTESIGWGKKRSKAPGSVHGHRALSRAALVDPIRRGNLETSGARPGRHVVVAIRAVIFLTLFSLVATARNSYLYYPQMIWSTATFDSVGNRAKRLSWMAFATSASYGSRRHRAEISELQYYFWLMGSSARRMASLAKDQATFSPCPKQQVPRSIQFI